MRNGTATVFEQMSRKITDGAYPSGSQMVESELAAEYGVSRNTVKKVLLMLENKGYVTIEQNKGARVRSFTNQEIEEMMQVRATLEGLVVSLAVPVMTDEQIAGMEGLLRTMKEHLNKGELLDYSEGNKAFHQVIYDACPNRTAVGMLVDLKNQIKKYNIKTILVIGRGQHSFEEHQAVLTDIKNRDAEAAAVHMRAHIAGVEKTMKEYQRFQV